MGDLKRAEGEYRKLLDKEEPTARSYGTERLGWLFKLGGRYKDSIAMAKMGIEQAEELGEKSWVTNRTLILAYMDVILGKPEDALKKCEIAWKSAVEEERLDYQRRALNTRALAYLKMRKTAEAERTAEELKQLIEQGINKNHIRLYYHLMGRIELEKSNFAEAIGLFNKGLPLVLPTRSLRMVYVNSLGMAYYRSGDFEKAREEFESIDLFQGRIDDGDTYAKSFYMLGKIYQEQGDTTKAIENYEKFLSLWKDADPGLLELEDARKRLAGLKSMLD
jgi:tetratricopeptide (TPR) repeat protein